MPTKHSKHCGDRHHFTYAEKVMSKMGSITQRLGSDSQLPFGYCPLSLAPIDDAVVSPSGHIYSREAILEYLLSKTQELKAQARAFEQQQRRKEEEAAQAAAAGDRTAIENFAASQEGVRDIVTRRLTEEESKSGLSQSRKRLIDDTDNDIRREELRRVSPWIVQFTPSAAPAEVVEPPKRPSSPFSGRPLRTKDLVALDLVREPVEESKSATQNTSATVKFMCPVSRDTITNQRVVFLRNTRTLMLQSVAESLAYPTMTCPVTGQAFKLEDVVEVVSAVSSFSATGAVEAKKYRPSIN